MQPDTCTSNVPREYQLRSSQTRLLGPSSLHLQCTHRCERFSCPSSRKDRNALLSGAVFQFLQQSSLALASLGTRPSQLPDTPGTAPSCGRALLRAALRPLPARRAFSVRMNGKPSCRSAQGEAGPLIAGSRLSITEMPALLRYSRSYSCCTSDDLQHGSRILHPDLGP